MSLAVAVPDGLGLAPTAPCSYEELARSLVLRRPELFANPGRSVRRAVQASKPEVQAAARAFRGIGPRKRGGRQLALPLGAPPAGMLR